MDKLDTVFSCPFCNHGSSAECRMIVPSSRIFTISWLILDGYLSIQNCDWPSFFFSDTKNLIGEANCQICQESFSTTANGMSKSYIKLQIVPPKIDGDAILIGSQLENYAADISFGFVPSQPNDCNSGNRV